MATNDEQKTVAQQPQMAPTMPQAPAIMTPQVALCCVCQAVGTHQCSDCQKYMCHNHARFWNGKHVCENCHKHRLQDVPAKKLAFRLFCFSAAR